MDTGAAMVETKRIVVSLQLQAVASYAAKTGVSVEQAFDDLSKAAECRGMTVVDGTIGVLLSAVETARVFAERRSEGLLTCTCPGWVCFVEKLHPGLVDRLSRKRNSQQTMGGWVKTVWAASAGVTPEQVYHVSVVSCDDRKLEASRTEFGWRVGTETIVPVGCVVTIREFVEFIGRNESEMETTHRPFLLSNTFGTDLDSRTLYRLEGSSAGGYPELAVALLHGWMLDKPMTIIVSRQSKDMTEYKLVGGVCNESTVVANNPVLAVLHSSINHEQPAVRELSVYGFANIQRFVRAESKHDL